MKNKDHELNAVLEIFRELSEKIISLTVEDVQTLWKLAKEIYKEYLKEAD